MMNAATLDRPRALHYADMAQTDAALAARREQGDVLRRKILAELARRDRDNDPAPTWAELAIAVKSTDRTVRYHCLRLRVSGLVAFDSGRARTLRLTPAGRAEA